MRAENLSFESVVFQSLGLESGRHPPIDHWKIDSSDATMFVWDQSVAEAHDNVFKQAKSKWPAPSRHFVIEDPEKMKSFENAPVAWQPLMDFLSQTDCRKVIVIGGGALSDSIGTLASLWHRGLDWSIVPTTWLSAMDAAHGGKTALNYKGKNQLGSFHLPERVYIDVAWMNSLAPLESWHAIGELHKTALLDYHNFQTYWGELQERDLSRSSTPAESKAFAHIQLSKYLRQAIAFKYSIVSKDPEEKTGLRRVLNLGHTLGHILESSQNWAHGYAVLLGLDFALFASEEHFGSNARFYKPSREVTRQLITSHPWGRRPIDLKKTEFVALLNKDKKHTQGSESKEWIFMNPSAEAQRIPLNHSHAWKLFETWCNPEGSFI